MFNSPADGLALLLEAAKSELDHDFEAAKTSLAIASSILQSEIDCRAGLKGSRTGGLAGWQIARVQSFIDQNLHRTIHARDLGAVARRSTTHFSRSFKQVFGEPPHAYIVRRRLKSACYLMLTSSASLSEIALSVGFADQAHLCKRFRKAFGQSPSNWRRQREPLGAADIHVRGGSDTAWIEMPAPQSVPAAARIARPTTPIHSV